MARALVDALAFGVPVVACRSAGIEAVVGDAALVLPAGEGVLVVAEALARVLTDEALRRRLVAAGAERLAMNQGSKGDGRYDRPL